MLHTDIQANVTVFTMGLIAPKAVSLFLLFHSPPEVAVSSVKMITQSTVFLSSITQSTEGCFLGSIQNCNLDRQSIALSNAPLHKVPGHLVGIPGVVQSLLNTSTYCPSISNSRLVNRPGIIAVCLVKLGNDSLSLAARERSLYFLEKRHFLAQKQHHFFPKLSHATIVTVVRHTTIHLSL